MCVTKEEEEAAETEEEAEPGGTDPKTRTHTTMWGIMRVNVVMHTIHLCIYIYIY